MILYVFLGGSLSKSAFSGALIDTTNRYTVVCRVRLLGVFRFLSRVWAVQGSSASSLETRDTKKRAALLVGFAIHADLRGRNC